MTSRGIWVLLEAVSELVALLCRGAWAVLREGCLAIRDAWCDWGKR